MQGVLKYAYIYDLYQWLIGTRVARDRLFDRYVSIPENCMLLDIGCGSGELLDYLPREVRYTGIDVNASYIEAARRAYGDRGRFECIDVNAIESLDLGENVFNRVALIGVLHHLDDAEVLRTLAFAHASLKPGGIVFTVDGVLLPDQSRITKFILSKDRGQYVRSDTEYRSLAESIFPNTETFIERGPLRFSYMSDYFIMRMTK